MISLKLLALFIILGFYQIATPVLAGIQIQAIESPCGLKAWFVADKATPVISLSFLFKTGSTADPEGKEGVADLTATMLMQGAGDLDTQAFSGKLQDLAIGMGYSVSVDTFSGSLTTLKENRKEAALLLNLTLTKPRLDPQALVRVKNEQLTYLANIAQDPSRLANTKIVKSLYPHHPYSRDAGGTVEAIPLITGGDIKNYIQNYLTQDTLVIGITGDLTAQEAGDYIDKVFKGVPLKGKTVKVPDIKARPITQTIVIPQDIPQSTILFAQEGITLEDPDLLKVSIFMHILGASNTSRLNEEIREKRGFAYSASAGLLSLKHSGLVIGNLGTSNAQVKECLALAKAEWGRMRDQGVTLKELNNAKSYLIGSFPLRFTNSSAISDALVNFQYAGKNADYINERTSLIQKITLKEINEVAKRLLKPDSLLFVVVGKPEGLDGEGKEEIKKVRK